MANGQPFPEWLFLLSYRLIQMHVPVIHPKKINNLKQTVNLNNDLTDLFFHWFLANTPHFNVSYSEMFVHTQLRVVLKCRTSFRAVTFAIITIQPKSPIIMLATKTLRKIKLNIILIPISAYYTHMHVHTHTRAHTLHTLTSPLGNVC